MKTEKVSIVTPCYNGEKYLERFLKSILNQSYGNIELKNIKKNLIYII